MALANVKRETAARMIAEDREPDYRIAAVVGVSLRTIQYCKKRPDVSARIEEIVEATEARLEAHYDRLEWLRERECCRMELSSKNPITQRIALTRMREMGSE